jgi:hypothetical protein
VTAVLLVAVPSALVPALVAVLGLGLPSRRPPCALAVHIIAAELDDYTWRADQLEQLRDHYDLVRAVADATEEWALARVYGHRPPEPHATPGIDVISRWWIPAPAIGRPPLTTRRTPGATLIGAGI